MVSLTVNARRRVLRAVRIRTTLPNLSRVALVIRIHLPHAAAMRPRVAALVMYGEEFAFLAGARVHVGCRQGGGGEERNSEGDDALHSEVFFMYSEDVRFSLTFTKYILVGVQDWSSCCLDIELYI